MLLRDTHSPTGIHPVSQSKAAWRAMRAGRPLQVLGRPRMAFTTSKAATFPSTQSLEDPLTTTQDHSSAKHSTEVEREVEQETYDWAKQWYPLAFVEDLDPKVPHPVELLGERLVLWRDADKQWRCFQDKCPHRLAPLSEGRIEPSDGTLMCSYHGWRFDGEGKCTDIPQSLDAKANAAACSNPRSCAISHPTQVLQGKVWVFGEGGSRAFIDSAAVKPALLEDLEDTYPPREKNGGEDCFFAGGHYARDLPYAWSTLMENLADPSHVNFSHHNVVGDRTVDQTMKIVSKEPSKTVPSIKDTFKMAVTSFDDKARDYQTFDMEFVAPCLVKWGIPPWGVGIKHGYMPMYMIPTGPGRSKILWCMLLPTSSMPAPAKLMQRLTPKWLQHISITPQVLDGDTGLLHGQEVAVSKEAEKDLNRLYYMPAQADRFVAAYRKWLAGRGGGGPLPMPETSELQAQPQLLDRYSQHTQNCPSCSRAVQVFTALRIVTAALAAVCAMGIASTLAASHPVLGLPAQFAAGGIVLAGAWLWLSKTIQKYYYVPHTHAHA
ncbi:hypothetical protein COCSUDRAFT_46572 [Coccomyxa subellipsoidea C-169]|uniref:Rieske domain-containing protein n=1 Tax=Coccomyxa subellipsoidea (strain C-169) TaxID=574566 RepID=I0Z337_COCSC|nr:hypothetical protein COCSUDRAFT_46572 [Coccomyxa subellipsoidea C-169]EIE25056.1 hypothetical protein COCSUDRAFT_46572 [Coccomyxa subellipsoidea C-169]|eukprot:XP_005649600.1 hypothetical protein COCSUDRAFT_46572 [Coccomyxa subellipsoidea C-169]